jgi:hypothetical protein
VRSFVGRVVRLLIIVFVLGGLSFAAAFSVAAQAPKPDPNAELIKRIEDMAVRLGGLPTANADLATALNDLSQAIGIRSNGCGVTPAVDTCLARVSDAIRQLNIAMTAALQKQPSAKLRADQVQSIEGQVTALAGVVAFGQPPPATATATPAPAGATPPGGAPAAPPATPSPATTAPVTTTPDPTATATEIAKVLAAQFKDKPPNGADPTNKDLIKGLQALPVPGNAAAAPSTPPAVINVLGAYFGVLNDIRTDIQHKIGIVDDGKLIPVPGADPPSPRYCSATRTMRTYCQGKQSCFDTITGSDKSSSHVTAAEMCGYDPVPYGDVKLKGLAVYFECLTTDPTSDQALYSDQPILYDQVLPPRAAYLRTNESAGIYCSQAATPKGQSANQTTTTAGPATFTVITGGQNTISGTGALPAPSGATTNQTGSTPNPSPAPAATPSPSGAQ